MEDDDVVHIGAVAHIFVDFLVLLAFQAFACADKTFFSIDIQFLVVGCYSHSRDIVEVADFGLALAAFTVFFLDMQEIVNGIIYDMVEIVLGLFHFLLNVGQLFIGLLDIELGNLANRFLA